MRLRQPILYMANRQPSPLYYNGYLLGMQFEFSIDCQVLLDAKLQVLFEHAGVPDNTGNVSYPVGVSVGLCMRGPAPSAADLPPYTTLGPTVPYAQRIADIQARRPSWLTRTGHNILGPADHYFADTLLHRGVIEPPGPGTWFYRIEAWGSAGTSGGGLANRDGVVHLFPNDINPSETDLNYMQAMIFEL